MSYKKFLNKKTILVILPVLLLLIATLIAVGITNAANSTTEPATSQTFTEEGDGYYIWVRAVDHAGNKGPWSEAQRVWIETGKPTITLKSNSNTTWARTGSVTVALQDSKSGLAAGASLKYGWSTSLDTAPGSYTTVTPSYTEGITSEVTFTASASGLTGKYYLWVVPTTLADKTGNTQTATVKSTGTFYFDNNAPTAGTATMKLGSSSGSAYSNNSWTNQSVYVAKNNGSDGSGESGHSSTTWTIAGTAESGTSKTLDPGSGKSATYSIVVTTADVAGNTASNTYTVKIDKKAPTLSAVNKVNGTTYNGDWTAGPVSTVLTFSDDNSGIDADTLAWKETNKDWTTENNTSTSTYTGSWSANRSSTGYYRIADNAGNYAEVSFALKIDTNNPTVSAKNSSVTITKGDNVAMSTYFTTSANGNAGISSTTYKIGSTSYSNTSGLAVGTYTVTCTVTKVTGKTASASMTLVVKAALPSTKTLLFKTSTGNYDPFVIPDGVEVILAGCPDYGFLSRKSSGSGAVVLTAREVYVRVTPGATYYLRGYDGSEYSASAYVYYSSAINSMTPEYTL